MSIETPLNSMLGIRHPVLLAPMDVIAGARLTAAVSRAGGFGILGGGYGERAWLEQETGKLKQQAAPSASVSLPGVSQSSPSCWISRWPHGRARS